MESQVFETPKALVAAVALCPSPDTSIEQATPTPVVGARVSIETPKSTASVGTEDIVRELETTFDEAEDESLRQQFLKLNMFETWLNSWFLNVFEFCMELRTVSLHRTMCSYSSAHCKNQDDGYASLDSSPVKFETPNISKEMQTSPPSASTTTLGSSPATATPTTTTPSSSLGDDALGEILDIDNKTQPRPEPGQIRLSQCAIDNRLRRIMRPRGPNPKRKVSEELMKQFEKGGKARKNLERVFQSCGRCWKIKSMVALSNSKFDHGELVFNSPNVSMRWTPEDSFVLELELVQSEILENDMVVEGEFVSEKGMEDWGWSRQGPRAPIKILCTMYYIANNMSLLLCFSSTMLSWTQTLGWCWK